MMPVDWESGRVLEDADVRDLRNRFVRLRTQLRFLYDREKQFGNQIDTLERALAEARNSQRLELQGYATQPRGATGQWPDGWVGTDFSMTLLPARKTTALVLDLWSPGELDADQELRIEMGRAAFSQILVRGLRTKVTLPFRSAAGQETEIRICASWSWVPAKLGEGGDMRQLAYKIISATLVH
jgi:hypothetical protein